jgi:molybdopterin/thiamine biosynthesis adenylyltransferase
LYYLAAAGVGTLGFCDEDVVEVHNLNRQILHFTNNINQPKVTSAYEKLQALNPHVRYVQHYKAVDHSTIEALLQDYDVIVDAVDNLKTRLLISDACYLMNKPLIEGAVVGLSGTITTIIPNQSPCLRCLYPKIQVSKDLQTCAEFGILGAVAGTIGSLQALEAIKVCTQVGDTLEGRLLVFEALDLEFETISYEHNVDCPLCGETPTITSIAQCGVRFDSLK